MASGAFAVPVLRTERLLLREWREADRGPFAALNADPVTMEHFPAALTRSESDAAVDAFRARWAEHGLGLWATERLDTGDFIGFVGLAVPTFEAWFTPTVEVGWRLAREHWGHGFATEAGRAALGFAFEVLGLDEVVSFTARTNERSWRVMQRLGMREVGAFDHPRVPVGHAVRPHVLYRVTAGQWRARPAQAPAPGLRATRD